MRQYSFIYSKQKCESVMVEEFDHYYIFNIKCISFLQGFFKRSTIRGEKYKCFFGGQCEITPQNRNRCKSCRFRLCLESGMSLEGKTCFYMAHHVLLSILYVNNLLFMFEKDLIVVFY